jgi:hypothetical protein
MGLIPSDIAHHLAIVFGLTVADIRPDARDVGTWRGPDDVLIAAIGKRRRLATAAAVINHENVSTALAG